MFKTHKSATCCYCGTKAVLSLGGEGTHELRCSTCGAPLSRLKSLKESHTEDGYTVTGKKGKKAYQPKSSKPKKKKKQKSLAHRFFDLAEDVFDVFD